MLEMILDKHMIFVGIGVLAALGVVSKCIVNAVLKRLVRAAGNMSKSTHPFMRLVRAKFEHACMVSDTVENVGVFVDKYLYEYKVAGIKLHSFRRMEKVSVICCMVFGAAGAFLEYRVHGMQDMVLQTAAAGIGTGIFVYLFHLTTDEGYRMAAVKNYMVDYLENVCLHRYEKTCQKELKVMTPEAPAPELHPAAEEKKEERWEERREEKIEVMQVPYEIPEVTLDFPAVVPEEKPAGEPVKAAKTQPPKTKAQPQKAKAQISKAQNQVQTKEDAEKEKEPVSKDILIRQILEEFMA